MLARLDCPNRFLRGEVPVRGGNRNGIIPRLVAASRPTDCDRQRPQTSDPGRAHHAESLLLLRVFGHLPNHWRERMHGGRRPKSLEGGNRGGSSHRRWCRLMTITSLSPSPITASVRCRYLTGTGSVNRRPVRNRQIRSGGGGKFPMDRSVSSSARIWVLVCWFARTGFLGLRPGPA